MLEQEAADCRQRRINRLHRESKLPADKTWETFKHDWVSIALRQQLDQLGHFISAAYTAKRDPALHCQSRKLDNFDFLLLNDLGYLPPGCRRVRGTLRPHRRTLRAQIAGHQVKPGLLRVGAHLCQPHGHRRGD